MTAAVNVNYMSMLFRVSLSLSQNFDEALVVSMLA